MVTNYLTIDVEDYFQVSAFEGVIKPENWELYESRIENNTRRILEILAEHNVRATFFILGWIAEKHPKLVKDINEKGHEIGCHSYWHRKVYDLTPDEFRVDTRKAKDILEGLIGKKIFGYRAPSYSITRNSLWALDILEEFSFAYDSSIFPIYHDIYGLPDAPRFKYQLTNNNMTEYPISTALFLGRKIPVSGGGYFRLFPYWFTKWALKRINEKESQPFVFYLHPWEIDPDQARIIKARLKSKFRHYINLDKTTERFERLLHDFAFGPFDRHKNEDLHQIT
jgi:polysaccharide deacetylase family protein (PEP-CTERM system associated)